MKWKDSDEAIDSGDDAGSAYEEDYSPLRSRNLNLAARLSSIITQPGAWIIFVGIVLLFVILLMFFPKGGTKSQQANLNQRLQQLESKVISLEDQNQKLNNLIEATQKSTDPLLVRLDRLESRFGKQLSDLQRQLGQLKSMQTKQAQTRAPTDSKPKKSTQKAAKTYIVQKGDTLYSISKQFSLSVSQLRKLNKLSSGGAIYPGQKLIIQP